MVKEGESARDSALPSDKGKEVTLSSFRGEKPNAPSHRMPWRARPQPVGQRGSDLAGSCGRSLPLQL